MQGILGTFSLGGGQPGTCQCLVRPFSDGGPESPNLQPMACLRQVSVPALPPMHMSMHRQRAMAAARAALEASACQDVLEEACRFRKGSPAAVAAA